MTNRTNIGILVALTTSALSMVLIIAPPSYGGHGGGHGGGYGGGHGGGYGGGYGGGHGGYYHGGGGHYHGGYGGGYGLGYGYPGYYAPAYNDYGYREYAPYPSYGTQIGVAAAAGFVGGLLAGHHDHRYDDY